MFSLHSMHNLYIIIIGLYRNMDACYKTRGERQLGEAVKERDRRE